MNLRVAHGPLTVVSKPVEGYGYSVAKYDKDGNFQALCNHMTHSAACELAFHQWNEGHVVDLSVK